VAGLAGVAATGALIARSERKRRAYTSDEIRQRLHARVAEASEAPEVSAEPQAGSAPEQPRHR
jgi:hypothetical protein